MSDTILSDDSKYSLLIENVQKQVLREFGFSGSDEDVSLLRSSMGYYAEDKELLSIPYYSKFNRCVNGNMKVGDKVEDVSLHFLDGNSKTTLFEFYQKRCGELGLKDASMVIVSGSIS